MNKSIQSISTKLYDVLSIKILQRSDTANGAVLQKRCSGICGLNPGLTYLQKVSKNPFLKLKFLKDIFQGFIKKPWYTNFLSWKVHILKVLILCYNCIVNAFLTGLLIKLCTAIQTEINGSWSLSNTFVNNI